MPSPRVNVSLTEKEYKQIQKVARKVRVSESQLCRNLIRLGMSEMNFFDKIKVTDLVGYMRSFDEKPGAKLQEQV